MKKTKDLLIIALIYILAYGIGIFACTFVDNIILKCFVFDTVATIITFIFSVILVNSSVYDAYWSLTPMVMSLCLFIGNRAFSIYQILFLLVFNIWSIRLTVNWITVFTDFSYEDWRYKKFRDQTPKLLWPIVNFFGIHYLPTIFVFLGMLPLFEIIKNPLGIKSILGMLIILLGVGFEYFADRDMHRFLDGEESKSVCEVGLWKFSRHPNYLGEITVWLGVYLVMLPYSISHWYYVVGVLGIFIMFNIISIPLMEKRQIVRRPEYEEYKKHTSRLFIMPVKKGNDNL